MKIRRVITIQGQKCWVTAENEQEYAERIVQLMCKDIPQKMLSQGKHLFKDYAKHWFEVFSKPNVEIITAYEYDRVLDKHIFPHLGEYFVEDILPADVQKVFNAMNGAKETKIKTKNVMNMVFEQAIEDGYIQRNPLRSRSIRITGRASKETKPYSVEQMQFIFQNISKVQGTVHRTYLALQAFHPMRLEEVLGLKNEDVDLENCLIYIRRSVTHPLRNAPVIKGTKTLASRRTIDLVPQMIPYITLGKPDEFVLGGETPLSYTQMKRALKRIQKEMGFDETISPRRFRSTVLTDIYDTTKDIKQAQAAAGHTTATMTLKHYVKGRNNHKNTAAAIAEAYGMENCSIF